MKSLDEIIAELAEKVRMEERGTWKGDLRGGYHPWFGELACGIEVRDGWRELVEHAMKEIVDAAGGRTPARS